MVKNIRNSRRNGVQDLTILNIIRQEDGRIGETGQEVDRKSSKKKM